MQGTLSTRPERKKERMRRRIIDEAIRLYTENGGEDGGVQNATVELICERADISIRTFFRYFDSKLDVIYIDYRQALNDLEGVLADRLKIYPPAKALAVASVDHFLNFVSDDVNRDRLLRALKSPHFSERRAVWRIRVEDRLGELVEEVMRPHPRQGMQARMLVGVIRGVFDQALVEWARTPDVPLPQLLEVGLSAVNEVLMTGFTSETDVAAPAGKKKSVRKKPEAV